MLSSQFCYMRILVFDQSSPVHPLLESRGGGGYSERDGRYTKDGRKFLGLLAQFNFFTGCPSMCVFVFPHIHINFMYPCSLVKVVNVHILNQKVARVLYSINCTRQVQLCPFPCIAPDGCQFAGSCMCHALHLLLTPMYTAKLSVENQG